LYRFPLTRSPCGSDVHMAPVTDSIPKTGVGVNKRAPVSESKSIVNMMVAEAA